MRPPAHLARTLIPALLLSTLLACGGGGGGSASSSSSGGVSTPVISRQPEAFTTEAGAVAVFSIKADSATPLTYQWLRQGVAIPGATSSNYAFQASDNDNGVDLSVQVSNAQGSVVSTAARLQVSKQSGIMLLAGQPGQSGMADGNAAKALFAEPAGLARDANGNLFISDSENKVIRKISVDGTVSTFAGKAGESGSTDGAGAAARFGKPEGLAFDAAGNLYVADTGNNAIRKIAANGQVSTLYKETETIFPYLAVSAAGTAYYGVHDWAVSDCTVVKSFTSGGGHSLALAGATTSASNCRLSTALDGWGTQAEIHHLQGLAVDATSDLRASTAATLPLPPNRFAHNESLVKVTAAGQKSTLTTRYFASGIYGSDNPDFEFGELTTSTASDIFVLSNGASCARILRYGSTGSLDPVAGQCSDPALKFGPLPGNLQPDMRGLVMDNEGSLYTTTQNAVIKIRLK